MTDCDSQASTLTPVDVAVRRVLDAAMALHQTRTEPIVELPLWDAHGHVLALDVPADRDVPPFDRAAMDGFAFRADDAGKAPLQVVGEAPAGKPYTGIVGPGQAVSIMTGAPVPQGCDTVEMIERCDVQGDTVLIEAPVTLGRHIARRGEDVRAGATAVPAGRPVQGPTVGVLSSVGATRVSVHRPARVSVLATGDELVPHTTEPDPFQIREGNRHTLIAMLRALRAGVVDGGLVRDEEGALREAIRSALTSDVVVLSGGVSKGKYDLVRGVLDDLGMELFFHGVQAKPGKPVLVGKLDATLVFGLPGNPVSTYVMAVLMLLPAVRTLAGWQDPGTRRVMATLEGTLGATRGRTTYHPGILQGGLGGVAQVRPVAWKGSGDLTGYAACNCLIRTEAESPAVSSGDTVQVLLCG